MPSIEFWSFEGGVATSVILGITGFLGTRLYDFITKIRQQRIFEDGLTRALLLEIERNIKDIHKSRTQVPDRTVAKKALSANQKRRPHFIYITNNQFFSRARQDLYIFKNDTFDQILDFYNSLEVIYTTMDSVQRDSYEHMTLDGKLRMLDNIVAYLDEAEILGERAKDAVERHISLQKRQKSQGCGPRDISEDPPK